MDNDVKHIFDAFEALGAVTTVQGIANEIFSMDLDGGATLPFGFDPPSTAPEEIAIWQAAHGGSLNPHRG